MIGVVQLCLGTGGSLIVVRSIRLAEEQDRSILIRDYLQHLSPHIGEAERYALLHLQVDRALLIEESGFLLGLATWGPREGIRHGVAQVTGMRIIASRRQQGLGSELFRALLSDMGAYYAERDAVLRRLFLFSAEGTAPFFERMGFQQVAQLPALLGAGAGERLYLREV